MFYNLPIMAAVLLVLGAHGAGRRRAGFAAMALVGIALQIKYSVVFEGTWIGLWLMWGEHRVTRSIGHTLGFGAALAAVALLPTAVVTIWFLAIGQGPFFLFANFGSILLRHSDPAAMQIDNAETALGLLGPLVVMTVLGISAAPTGLRERSGRAFLYSWLAVAVAGFVVFGGWYNHYTLPVMLPGTFGTAAFFSYRRIGRWLERF